MLFSQSKLVALGFSLLSFKNMINSYHSLAFTSSLLMYFCLRRLLGDYTCEQSILQFLISFNTSPLCFSTCLSSPDKIVLMSHISLSDGAIESQSLRSFYSIFLNSKRANISPFVSEFLRKLIAVLTALMQFKCCSKRNFLLDSTSSGEDILFIKFGEL